MLLLIDIKYKKCYIAHPLQVVLEEQATHACNQSMHSDIIIIPNRVLSLAKLNCVYSLFQRQISKVLVDISNSSDK